MNFTCNKCDEDIQGIAKTAPGEGIFHAKCFDEKNKNKYMNENFVKIMQDLPSSDETGRFFVRSLRTGKLYCVEPIGDPHIGWGDVDPVTKKLTGQYGDKFTGAIAEKDSIITEENGFKNIQKLEAGTSPMGAIELIDAKYPDK